MGMDVSSIIPSVSTIGPTVFLTLISSAPWSRHWGVLLRRNLLKSCQQAAHLLTSPHFQGPHKSDGVIWDHKLILNSFI